MNRFLLALPVMLLGLSPACSSPQSDATARASGGDVIPQSRRDDQLPDWTPAVLRAPVPAGAAAADDSLFDRAARAAWQLIDSHYYPRTGFVSAQPSYPYPTTWDIASTLLAFHAARELGFIDDQTYHERAARLLETLKSARLYRGIAYGRNYDARTGELVGKDMKPDENGIGYSAIDVGRLLTALAIVAKHDPSLADAARAAATRVDPSRIIRDGYLQGAQISSENGQLLEYQEGRIGYEQYSAAGFAQWGMRAEGALDVHRNAEPATVLGVPVTADKRGLDRLTSEPFILQGLELGWDPAIREVAIQTLGAQAQRFARTGRMTMASEDAVDQAPYYFFYYCVYCSGKPFVVNVHTPRVTLDGPRWMSTKAAFAWYTLLPNKYTRDALDAVQPALSRTDGWASGVYEGTGKSTATYSLNTAAVILEAAAYRKRGKPLIS